jgi:hypothetical protein
VLHPVLQLDQLGLQRQQGAEIDLPVDAVGMLALVDLAQLHRQGRLGDLQLEVLVKKAGRSPPFLLL